MHVASLGTAAGVALELKSRTALLLAGHGFAKGCSRGVTLVASAPWLTRGHPTENTNGSGARGLWRVVAGISVPSFCSGVAVGGITVSLVLGFVPSPLQSTTKTQEASRSELNIDAVATVAATAPRPQLPVETPVVANDTLTAGTFGRAEPQARHSDVEIVGAGDAKSLNGSDGAQRKTETPMRRDAQSVVFRGSLAVNSSPSGAQVFVNGEPAGTTPLALARVPAGSRVVHMELAGYETWSASVRVVANQRTQVRGNLTPRRPF